MDATAAALLGWGLLVAFVSYRVGWVTGAKKMSAAMRGQQIGIVPRAREWLRRHRDHNPEAAAAVHVMTAEDFAQSFGEGAKHAPHDQPTKSHEGDSRPGQYM
jgi:hypothetical protein